MRVVVNEWGEFLDELSVDAGTVAERTVRVRVDRTPLQPEAVAHAVKLWGTAVMAFGDGEYLLECGVETGIDDQETGEKSGTECAQELLAQLKSAADKNDLYVRHGKIEVM